MKPVAKNGTWYHFRSPVGGVLFMPLRQWIVVRVETGGAENWNTGLP
jgi:hypothetical protein